MHEWFHEFRYLWLLVSMGMLVGAARLYWRAFINSQQDPAPMAAPGSGAQFAHGSGSQDRVRTESMLQALGEEMGEQQSLLGDSGNHSAVTTRLLDSKQDPSQIPTAAMVRPGGREDRKAPTCQAAIPRSLVMSEN